MTKIHRGPVEISARKLTKRPICPIVQEMFISKYLVQLMMSVPFDFFPLSHLEFVTM